MCVLFACGHCYRHTQLNSYTCRSFPPVTFQVVKSRSAHQPPNWGWERRGCILTVVSAGQMHTKQPFTASMRYQEGGDGFLVSKTTNALLSVALKVRRTPLTLSPLVTISGVLLDHPCQVLSPSVSGDYPVIHWPPGSFHPPAPI